MAGQKHQVIVVTGASSGLGAAICSHLVAENHVVYGTGRKWSTEESVSGLHRLRLDLTDPASIEAAINIVLDKHGRIDVLINNAGIGIQGPIEDLSTKDLLAAFDTNVFGIHRMLQAVLPGMRQTRSGKIINISSIAGNMGLAYRSVYSACKSAVNRYSESLQQEVSEWGITVCVVEPGDFQSNIAGSRIRPDQISTAYQDGYQKCMTKLDRQMNHAPPPDAIVNRIVAIVATDSPRFTNRVGQPLEKLAVHLQYWLPTRTFLRLLKKFSE
jgi:NAD(P)-dependent dehydrogenase (short-subunit alcohol dehydrogenase family)